MLRKALVLENEIPRIPFVALMGTVNKSEWRDELISLLQVEYFDPIVEDWSDADRINEERAKNSALVLLYVITPKQSGTYALVEMAVSACLARDKSVIIVFLNKDGGETFDAAQLASNEAVKKLLEQNTNAEFYTSLKDAASAINGRLAVYQ